jgi:hypothetical protein
MTATIKAIPRLIDRMERLRAAVEREAVVGDIARLYGLTRKDALKRYERIMNVQGG